MFSPSIEQLITAFKKLPGVGQKSAQRMALYLLERNRPAAESLAHALNKAIATVQYCQQCHNLCDQPLCQLCTNFKRNQHLLCIVESPSDVIAIEQSHSYNGLYFVLQGHLSPIDGIGPEHLGLEQLKERLSQQSIKEIILATNCTVEGEATAHYILALIKPFNILATRIAHGIPLGGELEYTDTGTIAQAITQRSTINYR